MNDTSSADEDRPQPAGAGEPGAVLPGADTRAQGARLLGRHRFSVPAALAKSLVCAAVAVAVAVVPTALGWGWFDGLDRTAVRMLAILVLAAGLWMTEALPAFSVGLLVIALEMALLGHAGGPEDTAWRAFLDPWSSPLIWLFLGGFVLAQAAVATGLDRSLARRVVSAFGTKPRWLLLGVMAATFGLSMLLSNTATAAMMLAILAPVVRGLPDDAPFGRALPLGVAMAASVGGMGTLIGTPPNAIAAGVLPAGEVLTFLGWIRIGLPPAVVLAVASWLFLLRRYPCPDDLLDGLDLAEPARVRSRIEVRQRVIVAVVGVLVIAMWTSEAWHGITPPEVAFFATAVLAVTGVITQREIRQLPWDVLLLLTGGLALGHGVESTGLSTWFASLIPEAWPTAAVAMVLCYLAVLMSNFMSNTATASILLPIAVGLAGPGEALALLAPVALACSGAMLLPVSTPPNAVAFSSGRLATRDFLPGGGFMLVLAPLVSFLWCWFVL